MIDDFTLRAFVEDWWKGFEIYEAEDGRAYTKHLFKYVSKEHFVDFLRDALTELKD